jgi:zinc transport system substrate-binding protein
MRYFRTTIFATAMLSSATISAQADVYVVASIKPIHSLVSAVMQGVGEPSLLIEGAGSPHNYALKPSQAYELEKANLIFWIGHDLEAFLQRTIENIAPQAVSVPLIESHGIKTLPFREGASFEEHDHDKHDEHDHDKHDEHDHDKHDEHDHDKHDEHDHDKHDEHDHGEFDPHVWLDPNNAKILVAEIEEQLTKIYPKHADTFAKNANTITKELDALRDEINLELKDVKSKGYIVFHDAYQYFERRFDMSALGSITVSPEVMPGVNRIRKLQQKVKQLEAICVFSEPQFEPKLVATITENTSAGSGVLDPLGASIEKGPQLYFKLIRNMALSIKECLSKHD